MPAKSQAQRALLNRKFGHDWVKRHHFDNKGKLPQHAAKQEGLTARQMFERDRLNEADWDNTVPIAPSQLTARGVRPRRFGPTSRPDGTADHVHQTGDIYPEGARAARIASRRWNRGPKPKATPAVWPSDWRPGDPVKEGRDDAPKLGLGKEGVAYARMDKSAVMDQPGGTAKKVGLSHNLRKAVTNQKTLTGGLPQSKIFPSMDKAGKVPSAIKDSVTPEQIVNDLLE